jgi:hypothetical protein
VQAHYLELAVVIVEWLVSVANSIVQWLTSIMPVFEPPEWFAGVGDKITELFTHASGLNPFVDWVFVRNIALVPIGLWAAGFAFRGIRMMASHIPFFGGK